MIICIQSEAEAQTPAQFGTFKQAQRVKDQPEDTQLGLFDGEG